jgi:hypothetical protein
MQQKVAAMLARDFFPTYPRVSFIDSRSIGYNFALKVCDCTL